MTAYITAHPQEGWVATLYKPGRKGDDWTAQSWGATEQEAYRRLVAYNVPRDAPAPQRVGANSRPPSPRRNERRTHV
jgi:hypothetical protein